MSESQYTILFQESYRRPILIFCVILLGYILSQLMTYYLCFSLLTLGVLGSFLNFMHPHLFLESDSVSVYFKIYTRATLGKQGPLTSALGPPQGFPDSSVGKESICNSGDPGSIPVLGSSTRIVIGFPFQCSLASLVAQLVKNPTAIWETWVLWVWKIPWIRERLTTPGFLPGEFHGLFSPWVCQESDRTE